MSQSDSSCRTGMSRRRFLNQVAATGGALWLAPSLSARPKESARPRGDQQRPNILFIITDQQHAHAVGALGNPYLSTPAQDRLVREGVSVENSYCTNPLCMPSRSSFLTGRMSTETGVWLNDPNQTSEGKLDPGMPNLGGWLAAQASYDTIYTGKEHLPHSNTLDVPGFRVIAGGVDHRGDLGDMHVSRACEGYLREYADGDREQPFLLVSSLVQPHDVCHWLDINQRNRAHPWYAGMERVAPLPPLPHNFSFPEEEPKWTARFRSGAQPARGEWTEDHWRYYLWDYYRQVEMVDAEIGRLLTALDETGLAENTLVVLTSDHGEGMGEHQMVRKGFLYESACRIPLLARLPGKIPAGQRLTQVLASGMDFFPTFCDYAGVEAPSDLTHARSLRSAWEGDSPSPPRDYLVIEDNQPARFKQHEWAQPGRKVRTSQYAYIQYFRDPVEMLFDLKNDPGETRNLAREPRHAETVAEHRRLLAEWESELTIHRHARPSPWVTGRPIWS